MFVIVLLSWNNEQIIIILNYQRRAVQVQIQHTIKNMQLLTLDILNTWLCSLPPCIRKPHGAPPSSTTRRVVITYSTVGSSASKAATEWCCCFWVSSKLIIAKCNRRMIILLTVFEVLHNHYYAYRKGYRCLPFEISYFWKSKASPRPETNENS